MTRPQIYLFGDSITEESFGVGGWGASLANYFSRTADVVFRGYRGYNTRWALKVLEKVFPVSHGGDRGTETAPIALTIFFGANDACLPNRCSVFQHVPLHEYKDNLRSIVSFFKLLVNMLKHALLWPMSVKFLSLISGLKCNGSLDGKKFT